MIEETLLQISCLCFLFNYYISIFLWFTLYIDMWRIFVHYYAIGIIYVWIHALGHSKWGGWWRIQHMQNHHVHCYPFKKFLREGPYKKSEIPIHKDGNTLLFLIPSLVGSWLLSTNYNDLIGLVSFGLIILYREYWLHQLIHTSPNYLEGNNMFNTLRTLHYNHHKGKMKCNYGFCDPFHDWVLGTLKF